MMRELSNMAEDQAWEPKHTQIVEFINSLDRRLRRILKQVAEALRHRLGRRGSREGAYAPGDQSKVEGSCQG